jgi:transcription elongation factor SPT6
LTVLTQVFEPTEIRARHLTEDDDLIRAQDTPERMQLATSTLSQNFTLLLHRPLEESDLDDAAEWISSRISDSKYRDFFYESGSHSLYRSDLVDAVKEAIRLMFLQELEVPCIWQHKRDLISYFDVQDIRKKVELLTLTDLWRVYALGQKYRSLLERRRALQASYERLAVSDDYFVLEIQPKIDSVEVVADATEWLTMKYKHKKRDGPEVRFHDDVEEPEAERKRKMPSRISAYEVVKKTIVSKLAEVSLITK